VTVAPGKAEGYYAEDIARIKEEYQDVLNENPGLTKLMKISTNTGNSRPICQTPYKVPDKLRGKVKQEIDRLLDTGMIVQSFSPCASPVVPVLKPNGDV